MTATYPLFEAFPPRVYGSVTPDERTKLRRRNGGQRGAVMAWFESHPGAAISADRLAALLGLPCERGVASRMSELAAEGWLVKQEERVPGPKGIGVSQYRRNHATDPF